MGLIIKVEEGEFTRDRLRGKMFIEPEILEGLRKQ